ncbi:MAG: hypothetical protein ACFFCS_07765 [Candidatus Hodarchaeota archaeon]
MKKPAQAFILALLGILLVIFSIIWGSYFSPVECNPYYNEPNSCYDLLWLKYYFVLLSLLFIIFFLISTGRMPKTHSIRAGSIALLIFMMGFLVLWLFIYPRFIPYKGHYPYLLALYITGFGLSFTGVKIGLGIGKKEVKNARIRNLETKIAVAKKKRRPWLLKIKILEINLEKLKGIDTHQGKQSGKVQVKKGLKKKIGTRVDGGHRTCSNCGCPIPLGSKVIICPSCGTRL